ncbi:MAG: hypothetical protein HPY50_07275 [Firmicutes bacterium]|nr:hypothetical protein [Bacillota bacterium]
MQREINFLSLNKASDWKKGHAVNCDITDRELRLNSSEQYLVSQVVRQEEVTGDAQIMDFAVTRNGLLLLLDDTGTLWSYEYQSGYRQQVFNRHHSLFSRYALITVGDDILYLADMVGNVGISAYLLNNGQLLWSNPEVIPVAAAAGSAGTVFVVTPLGEPRVSEGRTEYPAGVRMAVATLDFSGRVVALFSDDSFRLKEGLDLPRMRYRFFVTTRVDGSVWVLDASCRVVLGFDPDGRLISRQEVDTSIDPAGIALDREGGVFLGDRRESNQDAEEDRYVVKLSGGALLRVTGVHGRADKLLIDHTGRSMYVLNSENLSLSVVSMSNKITPLEETGLPMGYYFSAALDSTMEETVWHKIELDAIIPEETQVRVYCFASDRKQAVVNGEVVDLEGFLSGEGAPLSARLGYIKTLSIEPMTNPRDALLHNTRGRYLYFVIEFFGSERYTPVLRRIRVYYPRKSLLSCLPAVYSVEPKSRDFLERFLSLYDSFLMGMEEQIEGIARYFDPEVVSHDYLRWLASWIAIAVDDNLGEEGLRRLVREAPKIYPHRGTRQGIETMVEIYTGEKPLIVEHFQVSEQRQNPEMKQLIDRLYSDNPYCFSVMVKRDRVPNEHRYLVVQKMLDQEKPAFTEAKLVVLQPWIYMDMHTYLGINSYLSEVSLLRLDMATSIPYDSMLIDVGQDNRMETHTRMDLDAELR